MSTTRYTVPIHESTQTLETRKQLNDMAMQYPLGTLDERNGGYYLLDHDNTVLAIASDSLCEELDASMEAAKRYHSTHPEIDDESESVAPQSEEAHSSVLVPIHAATHMPSVGATAIATCALEAIIGVSE
ncbi:hypothetical protein PENNAL_c0003G07064 [Penicillium nalgiovense]|nr:hypothetical protein PENNAL_c0003G07064 [Penicillium nalgiovense]